MSTIRERNAQFARLTTAHPDIRFMCAGPGEDRHALLTAGDALAKAADEVAWPWPIVSATGSPMTRLLAAIAAWKETTG